MMIRRSIVEKHGIRFPEGVACEDLYFHYAVFPWCRRVCVVSRAAYVYRKRAGSITSGFASGSSLQSLDYLTVAELVLKEWKEAGILEEYRTAFLKMLVMGVRNIRKYAPHAVQRRLPGRWPICFVRKICTVPERMIPVCPAGKENC